MWKKLVAPADPTRAICIQCEEQGVELYMFWNFNWIKKDNFHHLMISQKYCMVNIIFLKFINNFSLFLKVRYLSINHSYILFRLNLSLSNMMCCFPFDFNKERTYKLWYQKERTRRSLEEKTRLIFRKKPLLNNLVEKDRRITYD